MFSLKRMDPKLLSQSWANFLKTQVKFINQQETEEKNLANNPYYSKYANKIKNVKLGNKVESKLTEEESSLKNKIQDLDKKLEKKNESTIKNNEKCSTLSSNKPKKLNDIIKLDLIENLPKDEIEKIWLNFYKNKENSIFGSLNEKNYNLIKENSKKYPIFVFLIPSSKTDGESNEVNKNNYQFVLIQFTNNQVFFTPLAFYHLHKENSPPTLNINYYDEFKETKDLVLMEGEYDNKIFNHMEAQCLVNQIQIFYGNEEKTKILNKFNNDPSNFDYNDIVKEFEKSIAI